MNFLGHAYIAKGHPELIAGNFAGDSYKGKYDNFEHLPKPIFNGIKLHRFIDDFTDHQENVEAVAKIFQGHGIHKVTYIACDILIDHYLASNWKDYSSVSYEEFIAFIYEHTDSRLNELPNDFQFIYSRLKEYGWFFEYQSEAGIDKVLRQFSKRLGFKNDLDKCMKIYLDEKKIIDAYFKTFINIIVEKSELYIVENLS